MPAKLGGTFLLTQNEVTAGVTYFAASVNDATLALHMGSNAANLFEGQWATFLWMRRRYAI